jgi:hypothetical protein
MSEIVRTSFVCASLSRLPALPAPTFDASILEMFISFHVQGPPSFWRVSFSFSSGKSSL